MSKRHLAVALALVFALSGGWALAQQLGGGGPPTTVQGAPAAAGRYAVAVSDQTSVLVDTVSGKTWVQVHADGRAVWLPARRIDSDKEADAWRQEERDRFRDRRHLEKKEKAELEHLIQDERQKAAQAEADARRALEEAKRRLEDLERQRQKKD
jgi:hypothetical protein